MPALSPRWIALPTLERDRLYAAPAQRRPAPSDAQRAAVERLHRSCERVRPHLESTESLQRFVRMQSNPNRVRRRISLVLAMLDPEREFVYGLLGGDDLELFRCLALERTAALAWVFS